MNGVDVVVPCYNYARFLSRCVDSIVSQVGVDVRVLIIDDASSDDTPIVGRALAERDSRITFRRHSSNRGHIATYNEGLLDWAAAKYSALLSADDMLAHGALARAAKVMNDNDDVVMTYGMALILQDDENPKTTTPEVVAGSQVIPGARFVERVCAAGNVVPTPCAVVRTDVQKELGGYREDLPHSGDMEMWLRFACRGSIGVVRAVQGFYRLHDANMSASYYGRMVSDRMEQLKACRAVCATYGHAISGFDSWVRAMAERFAWDSFWLGVRSFEHGDVETCDAFLQCSSEFYSDIKRTAEWRNLRVKRALGPGVWQRAKPLVDHFWRKSMQPPMQTAESNPKGQIGWWPSHD